jgi:hypothetical protein
MEIHFDVLPLDWSALRGARDIRVSLDTWAVFIRNQAETLEYEGFR